MHAKQATEDQEDGLEAELLLAVGARIMLTRNIWTDRGIIFFSTIHCYAEFNNTGLANGTRATTRQAVSAPGVDYKIDLSQFIMLKVDEYTDLY